MREARLDKRTLWTIFTAAWATASVAAGFSFVGPILSLLLERMTGSGAFIGTFATVGAITTVTLTPLAPKLMARFKASHLLIAGCLLGALCFPLYFYIETLWLWFVIRYVQGLFLTIVFVAGETWINQVAPEEKRGRILSVYAMFLAGGLGLGAASSALLIEFFGLEGLRPFIIGLVITAIGAVPFLWPRQIPLEPPSDENARVGTLFKIMRDSPGLMATVFAFGAVEYSLFHLLPVYGVRLGYTESAAAFLLLALPIGNILLQYPIGMLADRFPRRRVTMILFAICTTLPLLLGLIVLGYAGVLILFGLFIGAATGLYTLGLSMLSERHKDGRMAAANSAFILCYGLGSLVAPTLTGVSMDAVGPRGMPLVMAALVGAGWLLFALFRPKAVVDTTATPVK